ncbi:hypothetical protein HHUSO_G29675 [Huso huso]|uniref:Uncharacterized protein n=1 Tax=Huso huso TaxID=61971 RepID=A0ABR0YF96_HUSHU
MFPDSEMTRKFPCGATKAAYLVCFGLSLYFKEKLIKDIRLSKCYVISFDVCLNKVTQTEQMDVVVRYWSEEEFKVVVHYLDSEFLGHTQAEQLLDKIKIILSPLDPKKLLQISIDGPKINWKFLRIFEEERRQMDPNLPHLHVVHGSFQQGEKEKLGETVRALWQLFHDTLARRDDFADMTKTTFPLKFCAHRWVEDLQVAECAIEIWPAVLKYIDSHKKLPKSKVPTSMSYTLVNEAAADPLFEAKLHFLAFVARQLKPFLETFQTDAPMVPFLAEELQSTLMSLLSCFIKRDILENTKTVLQMLKLDPLDKTLHVPLKQLDIGLATKQALDKASQKLQANALRGQEFKKECITFLATTSKKLLERSPLMYPAVRLLSSLDPVAMVTEEKSSIFKFEKLLQLLLNAKWCTVPQCDLLLSEYKHFLSQMIQHNKAEFLDFVHNGDSCSVDEFLGRFVSGRAEFENLWDLRKCLFTLSHGQAAVEKGYSVNKDMLVENLKERTLISLRLVQDSLAGRPMEDAIPRVLVQHAKAARMRYVQYLENEKKKKVAAENDRKRKELMYDIAHQTVKRQKMINSIEVMQREADEMAEKAEKKQGFALLSKSNAYQKSVTEKKSDVTALDQSCTVKTKSETIEVKRLKGVLFLVLTEK